MEFQGKVVRDDDIRQFRQQINQYGTEQIDVFSDYFWEDLIYIIESLDPLSILRELRFRNLDCAEDYQSLKKQRDPAFAETLLRSIRAKGGDAMLGFWESLYALQNDYPHPNLLGVLDEIIKTGPSLENQILLDQHGHDLTEELKECQEKHKQCLLEKTEELMEHRAPGLNSEPQSFPISERYLDLIVVSNQHFRQRSQHEVIATGGIHEHYLQQAQRKLERITPNRLFRWCHRSGRVPQTVLVSGVPGVGKTTLMQKFVYDWANGKLYQRFAFVFFFKFRNLNAIEDTSLVGMIANEYPNLLSELDKILQDHEKLLFIFDGLDESKEQIDLKSEQLCTHPRAIENLNVIVSSLVAQSLLKGCSVLITSRPTKIASIKTLYFHRISEIMGFFPKQREMYFHHFFQKNVQKAQKAFHYVRENGILYTFCYIPTYCWIVCTVLEQAFQNTSTNPPQNQLLPKTVTQLFVTFVSNILANHSQDLDFAKDVLLSVGWMAEHGVLEQVFAFSKESMDTFNVNTASKLLSSFIIESNTHPHASYSFFHLTIQEFLAALVHYLDYSKEKLQNALQNAASFEDGRGEIFLRFMCGLSDRSTQSLLKQYFGELSLEASKHVIRFLQGSICRDLHCERNDDEMRKGLSVFACLAESRNKALVSSTFQSNSKFNFSEFHLAPLDCTVLAFILESCKETELLDLSQSFIQTEGLERLAPTLHTVKNLRVSSLDQVNKNLLIQVAPVPQFTFLSQSQLTRNNLRDEDIQLIYSFLFKEDCKIQTLSLKDNGLTEESCGQLACAIHENKSLRDLDLSKNKLAGDYFYQLLEVLSNPKCRIERLGLQETKLTPEYCESLLLLTKNTNLMFLNISSNFFGDTSYLHIKELILTHPSLKEIRVGMNDFSEQTERNLLELKKYRPDVAIIV